MSNKQLIIVLSFFTFLAISVSIGVSYVAIKLNQKAVIEAVNKEKTNIETTIEGTKARRGGTVNLNLDEDITLDESGLELTKREERRIKREERRNK